jgi:hypothetical protein
MARLFSLLTIALALALPEALGFLPPSKPPCFNPLNYQLETICYNVTAASGNVTVRSMGVGLDAALITGMSAPTSYAEGSVASATPVFEYFLSDNGEFTKIPFTVPLIFRPSPAGTWTASFALPLSLFPTPAKAPDILPGSDLLLEPFAPPQAPSAGRLIAALTFYTIQVAAQEDYEAACASLSAALPGLGLAPVAGAWREVWVTYSTKEMVGDMVNECWVEVAVAQ